MKKDLLDRIDVKAPCSESWEGMTGNAEVRFCSHCSKDVYDLSAITRAKAERLVRDSNGRLCVRYVKDTRGKVVTIPPRLTQIKRQATVAASVLAASLTFSTLTYAQGRPVRIPENVESAKKSISRDKQSPQDSLRLSGLVQDAHGAVVPGAIVTLRNAKNSKIWSATSNSEGAFEFKNVESGVYEIEITSLGFKKFVLENLRVSESIELETQLVLEPSGEVVGLLIIDEPIETTDKPLVHPEIQTQPILPLPTLKNLPIMGLFPGFSPEPEKRSGNADNKKRKKTNNNLPK